MPTPLSSTTKVMFAASARALIVTLPPRSVKRIALDRRLSRIWLSARLSATISGKIVGHQLFELDARLARPQRQQVAAAGDDLRRIANGSGVISKLSVSIFDMSRMPLTTDKQMIAGIVDQPGIFVAPLGVEHQRRFLHQHFGEADDGIERRAQFVAHGGEEAALRGIGALGLGARVLERLLLLLALGDVAQHRDDFAAVRVAGIGAGLFERPAAHLDPDEFHRRLAIGIDAVAPHPELDRTVFRQGGGVAERGQISRPIGDMDAVEQAMAVQIGEARAEQGLGRRRHEQARRHRGRAA